LFFNRQTNRVDLEAFSYLYPLADAQMIRKMEGAEVTRERLEYVIRAYQNGTLFDQVFCASHVATRNSQRLNGFYMEPETLPGGSLRRSS
jgi:hypothetical protein